MLGPGDGSETPCKEKSIASEEGGNGMVPSPADGQVMRRFLTIKFMLKEMTNLRAKGMKESMREARKGHGKQREKKESQKEEKWVPRARTPYCALARYPGASNVGPNSNRAPARLTRAFAR
ncbi:hypothetical protein PIB30_007395 [Stylosanthes scabra]|uniref:Uncharacterized protein n=1 Tax=Stylosanthes scabra TaxID=79078 RepID=A0ABU6Z1B3_9FABA|nr:hypothetical protein [Stylosanthes scabra]